MKQSPRATSLGLVGFVKLYRLPREWNCMYACMFGIVVSDALSLVFFPTVFCCLMAAKQVGSEAENDFIHSRVQDVRYAAEAQFLLCFIGTS